MKISIENFKSIKKLHNFEIKPFTILSGVNSSGKSSFIQLLLLLKQTIEANNKPMVLEGNYYNAGNYIDIVSGKNLDNKLSISFEYEEYEISETINYIDSTAKAILKSYDNYKVIISITFNFNNPSIYVEHFKINVVSNNETVLFINCTISDNNEYVIKEGNGFFTKDIRNEDINITAIDFTSFFPLSYEKKTDDLIVKEFIKVDWVKTIINSFFDNISYLKPNREYPKDFYTTVNKLDNVGVKGEHTAQILEENAKQSLNYYKIDILEDRIVYSVVESTLAEAVKYWMCNYFEVASNLIAEKEKETYKITLTNKLGLKTSIKHVGFGISQLLPIVVEGLRMSNNGTLIIEQPEIHLHPKLQSKLYDFLYGLTKQGKKIIVETHSSHFITRMRRRIAEDETNVMVNQIGLTFIEGDIFRSIELDDYGTMDYYPEDFIEGSNKELKAIIKAQMKKRKKK